MGDVEEKSPGTTGTAVTEGATLPSGSFSLREEVGPVTRISCFFVLKSDVSPSSSASASDRPASGLDALTLRRLNYNSNHQTTPSTHVCTSLFFLFPFPFFLLFLFLFPLFSDRLPFSAKRSLHSSTGHALCFYAARAMTGRSCQVQGLWTREQQQPEGSCTFNSPFLYFLLYSSWLHHGLTRLHAPIGCFEVLCEHEITVTPPTSR